MTTTEAELRRRADRKAHLRSVAIELLGDGILLAGCVAIAYGISQLSVPGAWIASGMMAVAVARGTLGRGRVEAVGRGA